MLSLSDAGSILYYVKQYAPAVCGYPAGVKKILTNGAHEVECIKLKTYENQTRCHMSLRTEPKIYRGVSRKGFVSFRFFYFKGVYNER